jgi:hypothetical protein
MGKETKIIQVKGVNRQSKFPKFSSGSLKLTDDSWVTVDKKIDINSFDADNSYEVEITTNDKGYKSVTKLHLETEPKAPTATSKAEEKPTKEYWQGKDRSQEYGGLSHDAPKLVEIHVISGKPMPDILALYKEAMLGMYQVKKEITNG